MAYNGPDSFVNLENFLYPVSKLELMGGAKEKKLNHRMVAFEWVHPIIDGKCSYACFGRKKVALSNVI